MRGKWLTSPNHPKSDNNMKTRKNGLVYIPEAYSYASGTLAISILFFAVSPRNIIYSLEKFHTFWGNYFNFYNYSWKEKETKLFFPLLFHMILGYLHVNLNQDSRILVSVNMHTSHAVIIATCKNNNSKAN